MLARRQDVRFGLRVVSAAGTLIFCLLLVACGGGAETVARVGGERISEEDVERMVDFYAEEVEREGRELPPKGSDTYHFLETRLLGLLVYREQLAQAAANEFGVRLDEEEVETRVKRNQESSEEGGDEEHEAYIENAVRIQLVKEKVAARIGNRALQDWIDKALRTVPVHYEGGWAP